MSQEQQQTPVKKTNTSAWMTALKKYNAGKQWTVPKRDTSEYQEVLRIANEIKASMPPVEKVKKSRRKLLNQNTEVSSVVVEAPSKKLGERKSFKLMKY